MRTVQHNISLVMSQLVKALLTKASGKQPSRNSGPTRLSISKVLGVAFSGIQLGMSTNCTFVTKEDHAKASAGLNRPRHSAVKTVGAGPPCLRSA